MKRLVPPIAVLALGLCAAALAGDLESGLKVGDSPGAFNVKDVTGPSAGRSLCYR